MPGVQHIQPWGRVEGAIVDDHEGQIVFFVVRESLSGGPRRRVLVPLDAVEITHSSSRSSHRNPVLRVYWTPEQLRAQPTFAEDRIPESAKPSAQAVSGRWRSVPSTRTPHVATPSRNPARRAMGKQRGMVWGALASVAGLLIGVLFRDPWIAATLVGSFAVVGGVAGFLYGYSRESAADSNDDEPSRPSIIAPEIEMLEEALRDYAFIRRHGIHVTRIHSTKLPTNHGTSNPFLGSGGAQAHHA